MTTFQEVFGPKLGSTMEQNWPYIFLFCSVCLFLYQIGIGKIIWSLIKQLVIMTIMMISCIIWYVLMTQHINTLSSIGATTILSGIIHCPFFFFLFQLIITNMKITYKIAINSPSELVKNEKIIDPLTEIFIITGFTLFLLGILYRQLPVNLIPNFIPCIGSYDDMLAGFISFIGIIICLIGFYVQYNYSTSNNSTFELINKIKNYGQNAQEFIKDDNDKKWDEIVINTQYFITRTKDILKQSFDIIYNQINQQIEKNNNIRNEL